MEVVVWNEASGIPVSGSLLATVVAYVVFSLFVGGSLVSERTIRKSGWTAQCERSVIRVVKRNVPRLQSVPPKIDCKNAVGVFTDGYSSDADAFCNVVDLFLDLSPARQIENQNRKLTEAYNKRVANAATSAGSKCACASHVVQSDRVPWAIYAGSWRTVKPSELNNLDAKLTAALNSPLCAGVGQ